MDDQGVFALKIPRASPSTQPAIEKTGVASTIGATFVRPLLGAATILLCTDYHCNYSNGLPTASHCMCLRRLGSSLCTNLHEYDADPLVPEQRAYDVDMDLQQTGLLYWEPVWSTAPYALRTLNKQIGRAVI